ncbi:hypothetical protein IWW36_001745 [Coemansia brasiliensis]|uniref:Uncharacterized protein n=1 Tax=Coemansia brasiliensis TaxID=2650707 RepID=A0A9W8M0J8_9FUNG|nr:hypothetical protein IWW36_001745 [Coemansia brasiliensis]
MDNLPYDILHIVFSLATRMPHYTPNIWKESLQLAAVCHTWRLLILPMVYKYGAVQYGDSNTPLQITQTYSLDEPANLEVKSNLGLAVQTGNFGLIKHLAIRLNYKYSPLYGLQNILNYLYQISHHWHPLKILEIEIKGNRLLKEYARACILFNQYEIQKAASLLTQLLPQVNELKFSGYKPTPVAYTIYNQLAWAYCSKIQGMCSNFPLLNPGTTDFTSLTHLEMDFSNNPKCHLPPIYAPTLEYLSLSNIPLDYDWLPFYGTLPQTTVEFAHLKVLLLNYTENSKYQNANANLDALLQESSRHSVSLMFMVRKLLFPELEYLHIGTPGIEYHPIFEHSQFPCELSRLHLDGSIGMVQMLGRLKLPRINQITLNLIYDQSPDMSIAFRSINQICSHAQFASNVRLEVYNYEDIQLVSPINCPYITELDIKAFISATRVFQLIQRLPRLSKLELSGIRFTRNDMVCLGNMELISNETVGKSQISYLSILQNIHLQPAEEKMVMDFILYLLSKLNLLSSLKLRKVPMQPIHKFISENQAAYPHLSAIELNI